MSETRALHLVINGRVQGVGFRWFVRNAARALELYGRVRNLPDGAVEVHAAADPETLARFIARLREGPPASRVTAVDEQELATVPDWHGFEIEH